MDCFEDKLLDYIGRSDLFAGVKRVLLAVSGGADSVAMMFALHALYKAQKLPCELAVGHVNHCLRAGESDGDELFVKELAHKLGLPFLSTRVDVREYAAAQRLSIETAARTLRHKALLGQCKELGCGAIVTAHHLNDQAETMIHRLSRGTGFRGLCGIRPVSNLQGTKFVRPMLCVSRTEIEEYCACNQLNWRQDATNLEIEYTRNRIRHKLVPVLASDWPTLHTDLGKFASECGKLQHRIETHAKAVLAKAIATRQPNNISLHRNILAECPPWILYEVIREILVQFNIGLRDYTQSHFDAIYQQVQKGAGRSQYPGHIHVKAKKKTLVIEIQAEA